MGTRTVTRPNRARGPVQALFVVLAAVVTMAVLAAGCGDDDDTTAGPTNGAAPGDAPDDRFGGRLVIADKAEITNFDPTRLSGSSSTGANQAFAVFDALMIDDPETGAVVPQLAEDLTTDDGITWTLVLRPGVEFTDGTPLDAEAVKFNWERHQDPDRASPNAGAANQIAEMTVVDELTLEVTLSSANAAFPSLLTDRLAFIGSPTALTEDPDGFAANPVGAGPFVLDSWVRDDRMVLVRNDAYWNAPYPYLDELVFRVIVDGPQRAQTFANDEIDVNRTTAPADVGDAESAGHATVTLNTNLGTVLLLNHAVEPFDDPDVRRAVTLAIDRQVLVDITTEGAAPVMTSLFAEGSRWRLDDLSLRDVDSDAAQAMFDQYEADNGAPLSFTILAFQNVESQDFAQFVQATLLGYGVDVSVDVGEAGTNVDQVFGGTYQAIHWSFPAGQDPEPLVYDSFHSESGRNVSNYSNPEVDAALEAGRAEVDFDDRFAAYRTVQQHLIDDDVAVWTYHQVTGYIHHGDVHDIMLSGDGIVLADRVRKSGS